MFNPEKNFISFSTEKLSNKAFFLKEAFSYFLRNFNQENNLIFEIDHDNFLQSATNKLCSITKQQNKVLIKFPEKSNIETKHVVLERLLCVLYIFLFVKKNLQNVIVELADKATTQKKIIGFSSIYSQTVLIPDFQFIRTLGFEQDRKLLFSKTKQINIKGIWMGALNSHSRLNFYFAKNIKSRVNFYFTRENKMNNFFFKKNYNMIMEKFSNRIDFKERINFHEFLSYLIQIDIEGRAATFSSLFLKLASGYPTIKVESDYKQWYYDRLHSLPNLYHVKKDFSDFDEVYNKIIKDYNNGIIKIDNKNNFLQNMKFNDEILNAAKKIESKFGC
jgi:hypothetical protein